MAFARCSSASGGMDDAERVAAPGPVRAAHMAITAGAWADALEELGAVRSDRRPRPRLTYEATTNGYGEEVQRPHGIALDDWTIPLRRQRCEIRRAETRPQAAPPTVQEVADTPRLTVTVSCPRACPVHGEEAAPVTQTGPPRDDEADFWTEAVAEMCK